MQSASDIQYTMRAPLFFPLLTISFFCEVAVAVAVAPHGDFLVKKGKILVRHDFPSTTLSCSVKQQGEITKF